MAATKAYAATEMKRTVCCHEEFMGIISSLCSLFLCWWVLEKCCFLAKLSSKNNLNKMIKVGRGQD